MHQMRDIGNRLQRDLGAVEGASSGGPAGRQLLGAAFLAFLLGLPWFLPQPGSSKTSWILLPASSFSLLRPFPGLRCPEAGTPIRAEVIG